MSPHPLLVRLLVRLYPRSWRNQYGAEFASILETCPLGIGTVLDVVRGASWQRLRAVSPATMLGTGAMLFAFGGLVLSPTAYGRTGTALIQASHKTFPTITVTFFESEIFALLLMFCGAWTQRRYGRGAAKAAMWMTILAGVPVTIFGILMLAGAVDGYSVAGNPLQALPPHPWAMVIAPAVRSLESAIWGTVGGQIGRRLGRTSQSASA